MGSMIYEGGWLAYDTPRVAAWRWRSKVNEFVRIQMDLSTIGCAVVRLRRSLRAAVLLRKEYK